MPEAPRIKYAPRHAAISAMIEIVATPPTPRFVVGETRSLLRGERFWLRALSQQPPYPTPTEWVATGDASIVARVSADLQKELMEIWEDRPWVFAGDEMIRIAARPVLAADGEQLISAYCAETGSRRDAACEHFTARWRTLREHMI